MRGTATTDYTIADSYSVCIGVFVIISRAGAAVSDVRTRKISLLSGDGRSAGWLGSLLVGDLRFGFRVALFPQPVSGTPSPPSPSWQLKLFRTSWLGTQHLARFEQLFSIAPILS